MQSVGKWIMGVVAFSGISTSAMAAWVVTPTNGWQVDYSADSNILPDMSTPTWSSARYNPSTAQIINVLQTNEKTLALDHLTNDPAFTLNNAFGGAAGTSITMDTRFRVTDATQASTQSQLRYILIVPTGVPNQRYLYLLDIASGQVNYSTATGSRNGVAAFDGDEWNYLRWHVDISTNTASIYLNGSDVPAISHAGVATTGAGSTIEFGDNTGSVLGKANVSFVRLTNEEFVAVPEPASLGLIAAAGLLIKRRRSMK